MIREKTKKTENKDNFELQKESLQKMIEETIIKLNHKPMTIEEYKKKFCELALQMRAEHGDFKKVCIDTDKTVVSLAETIIDEQFSCECTIKF